MLREPVEHLTPQVVNVRRALQHVALAPIPHEPGALALAEQRHEELLALLNRDIVEIALDDEERRRFIWQMQNLVHDDVVYIIPFYQKAVQAYRSDTFRGWLINSGNLDLTAPSSLGIVEPLQP